MLNKIETFTKPNKSQLTEENYEQPIFVPQNPQYSNFENNTQKMNNLLSKQISVMPNMYNMKQQMQIEPLNMNNTYSNQNINYNNGNPYATYYPSPPKKEHEHKFQQNQSEKYFPKPYNNNNEEILFQPKGLSNFSNDI